MGLYRKGRHFNDVGYITVGAFHVLRGHVYGAVAWGEDFQPLTFLRAGEGNVRALGQLTEDGERITCAAAHVEAVGLHAGVGVWRGFAVVAHDGHDALVVEKLMMHPQAGIERHLHAIPFARLTGLGRGEGDFLKEILWLILAKPKHELAVHRGLAARADACAGDDAQPNGGRRRGEC